MDRDSSIAWLRARIKADMNALADYESGRVTIGEIVDSKKLDQTQEAIADLKRKIAANEKLIAAYEKRNAARP